MALKKVKVIATKYKNEKPELYFYTNEGKRICPEEVKRTPNKNKIEFMALSKRKCNNRYVHVY